MKEGSASGASGQNKAVDRPPTAPQNLMLTPGDGRIEVSWDAPEDAGSPEFEGYFVRWRAKGATDWESVAMLREDYQEANDQTPGYDLDGLTNGQEYEVEVAAFHNTAVSAPDEVEVLYVLDAEDVPAPEQGEDALQPCGSERVTADCYVVVPEQSVGEYAEGTATPAGKKKAVDRPPSAPRNLTLTPGNEQIEVSWKAPADLGEPDDFIGYVVEIREVGERDWFEYSFTKGTSETIDWILDNGVEYEVRVIAFNIHGDGIAGPLRATPRAE